METNREKLLKSKEYWLTKIQNSLFNLVDEYISSSKVKTRSAFANKIGVSKGYVSQVLNGDYDHRVSKLVELSLAIGKAPYIEFRDLDEIIVTDKLYQNGAVFYTNNLKINTFEYISNSQLPVHLDFIKPNSLISGNSDSISYHTSLGSFKIKNA